MRCFSPRNVPAHSYPPVSTSGRKVLGPGRASSAVGDRPDISEVLMPGCAPTQSQPMGSPNRLSRCPAGRRPDPFPFKRVPGCDPRSGGRPSAVRFRDAAAAIAWIASPTAARAAFASANSGREPERGQYGASLRPAGGDGARRARTRQPFDGSPGRSGRAVTFALCSSATPL